MPTTTITAVTALKNLVRDRDNSFMSDDEYERCLLDHATAEATYPASRLGPGYWSVTFAPFCLLNASFTEEPGASYTLCCGGGGIHGGVSIKLTAGVDVREQIDITGGAVDFNQAAADLLTYIANHRALEYTQSIGGGRISPETARLELIRQAELLQGVRAA
jgi:hypothetical protein